MRPAPSALRSFSLLLAFTAVMLTGPATAAAAPTITGEFTAPGIDIGPNNEITLGPGGNMWVTLAAGGDLARIAPDGTVTSFETVAINGASGITATPDGNMWVTQTNAVVKFSPADPVGTAVATPVNAISQASAITVGPDANLWTVGGVNVIKIPPSNPAGFTAYPVLGSGKGIASGSDQNLWAADSLGSKIVSVTTAGTPTAYPVSGGPQGVAAGPNGQIAYSDPLANPQEIGRLVAGGTAQITSTPLKDPFGVAFGPDGAYWFADFAANDLGRLTTDGTYTSLTGFSAGAGPRRIAAGPTGSNTLWVTLDTADKIARVTGVDPPVVDPPVVDPDPIPPTGKAPEVTIDKQPGKKIKARAKRTKVKFKFSSPTAGAKFECSLSKKRKRGKGGSKRIKGDFRQCASPVKYKLKPGSYTFSVRASADDLTSDAEKAKFKVVKPEKKG